MTTLVPLMSQPLGFGGGSDSGPALFLDPRQTVLSQYANSPVLLALIDALGGAIDRQQSLNDFYDWIWNVDTAQGFGLDIWGRIVGVTRSLFIPSAQYLGFSNATDDYPFGDGVFWRAANIAPNYQLTDMAYRQLVLAKAALNITDSSIPAINAILRALFPTYGNVYVRDNRDMTLTYVFGAALSKVDYAIVTQSGVLPRPLGVSMTVETP